LLTLDDQGNLYIADGSFVRKITTDGMMRHVAGASQGCNFGTVITDDVPAATACLGTVRAVAFDKAGNLLLSADNFFSGSQDTRIRKIRSDGMISTLAGPGAVSCRQGGGVSVDLVGPAQTVCPTNIFFSLGANANNDIVSALGTHVAIVSGRQTKWVGLEGSAAAANEGRIPSRDGNQMYVLNPIGKHDRTVDTRTGAILYQFGYDTAGLLQSIQDGDGNVTTIARDAGGNPTEIVGPYGHHTSLSLDANGYLASVGNPMGETHHMVYDDSGLLKTFQTPRGPASTFTFDVDGRLQKDQNAAGGFWQLDRTFLPNGAFEVAMTTAMGRLKRHHTDVALDDTKLRTSTLPDGSTHVARIGANGVFTVTDRDGTVTTTTTGPDPRFGMQAPMQNAFTVVLPSGLTLNRTASRTVSLSSPNDPLALATQTDAIAINGRTMTTSYDAVARQFTTTSPEGRTTTTRVDAQGRPTSLQIPGVAPVSYSYDPRGRVATVTQGSGADARSLTMGYGSDGFVQSITDALSRQIIYQRDPVGRVNVATQSGVGSVAFGYDTNGNISTLTPPGRPTHGFQYTPVDTLAEYAPPAASLPVFKTTYAYNADQQLATLTRPDGLSIALGYDNAGRLATKTPSPGGGDPVTYGYAPSSGRLASILSGGTSLTYAYDGRLLKQEAFSGLASGTVDHTYDSSFRVSGVSVNGSSVAVTYDNDSLLKQVGSLSLVRDAANGNVKGSTLGTITTVRGYDAFDNPASFSATASGAPLYSFTLSYDQLNRVSGKTEVLAGVTTNYVYGYDLGGRLQSVAQDGQVIRTYGYDPNGNRISVNGAAVASYDDQDRMLAYGAATYAYGANGELSSKTEAGAVTTYTYDVFGNLKSVALGNGTSIEYLVDGRSRRIGKKVNGAVVQTFIYDGQIRIVGEFDGAGVLVSRFVYAAGNAPEYFVKGGNTYRLLKDQVGSVRLVVNAATGSVAQRIDYDEWGNVVADSNPGLQPFGFAGGLYDRDTGLVRFGARDYDPHTGRWLRKDPIRFRGGDTNLYAYAAGNPVTLSDPLGLTIYWNGKDSWTDAPDGPGWTPYNPGGDNSSSGKEKPQPQPQQEPKPPTPWCPPQFITVPPIEDADIKSERYERFHPECLAFDAAKALLILGVEHLLTAGASSVVHAIGGVASFAGLAAEGYSAYVNCSYMDVRLK
jgi:RHS repeat-associated protein